MKRICAGAACALLWLGASAALVPTVAQAQDSGSNACFPGSDPDYPPTGAAVSIDVDLTLLSGHFTPGGAGHIEIGGATANTPYCGQAFSTPINLPAKDADASGKLIYDIATPADFELNAAHHIDVYQLQTKVGNFDFCVNKTGDITALGTCGTTSTTKAKAPLARTGSNHAEDLAKAGVIALGIGAGALYLRRRRLQTTDR